MNKIVEEIHIWSLGKNTDIIKHEILYEILQISKIGLLTEPDINLLFSSKILFIGAFTIKPLRSPYSLNA